MYRITKKGYTILSCIVALIVLSVGICTFNSMKRNDVEKVHFLKEWTIYFSKEINESDLENKGVTVVDANGKKVECSLTLGEYGKSIKVSPPSEGYIQGNVYTLNVKNNEKCTIEKVYGTNKKSLKFQIYKEKNLDKAIQFRDKNFENIIRKQINKPSGEILGKDVCKVTSLILTFQSIRDITGLEYFTNIHKLALDGNQITSIKPLKNLTDMEYLGLSANNITSISYLKNMKFLNNLYLHRNKISSYGAVEKIYKNLETKDFSLE